MPFWKFALPSLSSNLLGSPKSLSLIIVFIARAGRWACPTSTGMKLVLMFFKWKVLPYCECGG